MHVKSWFIMVTTIAILLGSLVTTAGFPTSVRVLAYESSQAGSLANTCGNADEAFNILCQNLLSQIEGDGNAVNIIGLQTGGERTASSPPPEETATIILSIIVECVKGQECPGLPVPPPDITIDIPPGDYKMAAITPSAPDGLDVFSFTRSEDCDSSANGPIKAGEVRECILTIIYEPEAP